MVIYLVVLLLNIFLAFCADRAYAKNKLTCMIFLGLIILVNVLFVGLRDFSVGTDTSVYIDYYFKEAGKLQSFSDMESFWEAGENVGFLAIAYVANLLSADSQALLVLTELFIISFITLGIYHVRKVLPVKFSVFFLLFCLLYYMHTMNLMRQYCAMALLFFAFSQLLRGQWIIYTLLQFIAFFFHSTSVVFLIVALLYFISKIESDKKKIIFLLVIVGAILFFLTSYYTVLLYFGELNIISEIYVDRYGAGSEYENTQQIMDFGMLDTLNYVMPMILIFMGWRKKIAPKHILFMILSLYIASSLLEQLKYVMIFMFRLAHYIGLVFCVYGSLLFSSKKVHILLKVSTFAVWLYVFYRTYFTVNYLTDHIKYSSQILGVD